MSRKTIIVTGGSGLIGSALIEALVSDYDVHCISRRAPTSAGVTWHQIDLSATDGVESLPSKADAVVYLAQSEHFREFPERAREIFQVNTIGLLSMLNYARLAKVGCFVYGSSGGVYGAGEARMTEEFRIPALNELSFYLSTKLCSEIVARNYADFFNVVILRYFFVYGRNQRQDMLVPRLMQRIARGEPVLLDGCDGIRINPIHVSDAALATRRALEISSSMTFNVAGAEVLSLRQIGSIIGRELGREPIFRVTCGGQMRSLTGDIARMCDMLGEPRVDFVDGVRSML